ncbi:MAG: type II toxin-antitoxin system HicB family antitoxin [Oscillospiraceae bacterium]|nr:type II toxin-antitoxin system HicB family antitoxin [Oscillospiraceae bacterium]
MKNIMEYRSYSSKIEYCNEDEIFYGKILGIDDLVSFEGETVEELKKDFKEAVDYYIKSCERDNKEAKKQYKGSFNIRIGSEIHKKIAFLSEVENISLNQFIKNTLKEKAESYKLKEQN